MCKPWDAKGICKFVLGYNVIGKYSVHQSITTYLPYQSHKKAGTMWREAGLQWKDFLPEDVDVNKFVTEKVRVHSVAPLSSK